MDGAPKSSSSSRRLASRLASHKTRQNSRSHHALHDPGNSRPSGSNESDRARDYLHGHKFSRSIQAEYQLIISRNGAHDVYPFVGICDRFCARAVWEDLTRVDAMLLLKTLEDFVKAAVVEVVEGLGGQIVRLERNGKVVVGFEPLCQAVDIPTVVYYGAVYKTIEKYLKNSTGGGCAVYGSVMCSNATATVDYRGMASFGEPCITILLVLTANSKDDRERIMLHYIANSIKYLVHQSKHLVLAIQIGNFQLEPSAFSSSIDIDSLQSDAAQAAFHQYQHVSVKLLFHVDEHLTRRVDPVVEVGKIQFVVESVEDDDEDVNLYSDIPERRDPFILLRSGVMLSVAEARMLLTRRSISNHHTRNDTFDFALHYLGALRRSIGRQRLESNFLDLLEMTHLYCCLVDSQTPQTVDTMLEVAAILNSCTIDVAMLIRQCGHLIDVMQHLKFNSKFESVFNVMLKDLSKNLRRLLERPGVAALVDFEFVLAQVGLGNREHLFTDRGLMKLESELKMQQSILILALFRAVQVQLPGSPLLLNFINECRFESEVPALDIGSSHSKTLGTNKLQQQSKSQGQKSPEFQPILSHNVPQAIRDASWVLEFCVSHGLDQAFKKIVADLVRVQTYPTNPYAESMATLRQSHYTHVHRQSFQSTLTVSHNFLTRASAFGDTPIIFKVSLPEEPRGGLYGSKAVLRKIHFRSVWQLFSQISWLRTVEQSNGIDVVFAMTGSCIYGGILGFIPCAIDLLELRIYNENLFRSKGNICKLCAASIIDETKHISLSSYTVLGLMVVNHFWALQELDGDAEEALFEALAIGSNVFVVGTMLIADQVILVRKELVLVFQHTEQLVSHGSKKNFHFENCILQSSKEADLFSRVCRDLELLSPHNRTKNSSSIDIPLHNVIETTLATNYQNDNLLRTLQSIIQGPVGCLEFLGFRFSSFAKIIRSRLQSDSSQILNRSRVWDAGTIERVATLLKYDLEDAIAHKALLIPSWLASQLVSDATELISEAVSIFEDDFADSAKVRVEFISTSLQTLAREHGAGILKSLPAEWKDLLSWTVLNK